LRLPPYFATIDEIEAIVGGESFLLSDLNRNWWQVAHLKS